VTGEMLTMALTAGTELVWLIRLEGRVNTQDAQFQQMRDDLHYVRERIDKALNGYGRH